MNWSARIARIGVVVWLVSSAVAAAGAAGDKAAYQPGPQGAQQATQQSANDAGLKRFRSIYKELVETNTQLSARDCTVAAQRMAARLKAAG